MSHSAELSSDESHDFKGYSSVLELVAHVSFTDVICQTTYGDTRFAFKTHLFVLMNLVAERDVRSWKSSVPVLCDAVRCSRVTNLLRRTLGRTYLFPSNIKDVQDISQMACSAAQKQHLTLRLGAEANGNLDALASLISLQHTLVLYGKF